MHMKKIIFALTLVNFCLLQAKIHTNKTFLTPRPTGFNLPMTISTWTEMVNRKNNEDRQGANFQAVCFYEESLASARLGRYFGVHDKNNFLLTAGTSNGTPTTVNDVDILYLIHDHNNNTYKENSTLSLQLQPKQSAYGTRFDYEQDLEFLCEGLFFQLSIPVACIQNDVHLNLSGGTQDQQEAVNSYFRGEYKELTVGNQNQQSALTKGLYTGRQEATGIADVDVIVGSKYTHKKNLYTSIALAITIPSGNNADGTYLFQPIIGNGQHIGLGFNVAGQIKLIGTQRHNLKAAGYLNYRYLFAATDRRTLNITDDAGNQQPWGQYYLLGIVDTTPLVPAGNLTTMTVNVTPRNQIDGALGFTYNNDNFSFDFGYNLFAKNSETIHAKDTVLENLYIAARNWKTGNDGKNLDVPFDPDFGAQTDSTLPFTNDRLVVDVAKTPAQVTHSFYASMGYIYYINQQYPLMINVGGMYEWPQSNGTLEKWYLFSTFGIGF